MQKSSHAKAVVPFAGRDRLHGSNRGKTSEIDIWTPAVVCPEHKSIKMLGFYRNRPSGGMIVAESDKLEVTLVQAGGVAMRSSLARVVASFVLLALVGCSTPLTTREEGAGIGAFGGAAAGGIIGSIAGHAGAGAAIGGLLGLGAGALIGDQLQGQETKQSEQEKQIERNQAEIQRQRREIDRLQSEGAY